MLELKDDQIFVYKTRAMPNKRSLNQKLFSNSAYPWDYHFTCNDLLEGNLGEKYLSFKSENFFGDRKTLLQPYEHEMVLVSNPDYFCSWSFDGTHSDVWTQFEKGIGEDKLQKFYDDFLSKGIRLRGKYLIGLKTI
jgi:hypothetical protein